MSGEFCHNFVKQSLNVAPPHVGGIAAFVLDMR